MSSCFFEFNRQVAPLDATIVGRVIDDQGNELEGVRVVVLGTTLSGASNSEGRFSQNAPQGELVLRFEADVDGDGIFERAALRALRLLDVEVDIGDVILERTVSMSGRVEDDAGNAIANAQVEIFREFTVEGASFVGFVESNVESNNDGSFVLNGIVPGNVRLQAKGAEVQSAVIESRAPSENNILILPTPIPDGCLRFENPVAGDALDALEGVECVTGTLALESIDELTQLSSLQRVGSLSITSGSLRNLEDLQALQVIENDLLLSDLPQLTSLDALSDVRLGNGTRAGRIALTRTSVLSFSEPELPSTIISLTLLENSQLINAGALGQLGRVDEDLTIAENAVLLGLDDLEALEFVGGEIVIENNSDDVQDERDAFVSRVQP